MQCWRLPRSCTCLLQAVAKVYLQMVYVFTSIKRARWSCVSVLLVLWLRLLDMVDSP
jgi:hypothetical protein